ncbi:hypothetical protein AB0L13_07155 [Saccharopolyspora shandongensis]|uniref:hypothetical protein n=1 Tax=Saccharopolyspora shandongensis TaxID=418495 RepID=UPI00341CA9B2
MLNNIGTANSSKIGPAIHAFSQANTTSSPAAVAVEPALMQSTVSTTPGSRIIDAMILMNPILSAGGLTSWAGPRSAQARSGPQPFDVDRGGTGTAARPGTGGSLAPAQFREVFRPLFGEALD